MKESTIFSIGHGHKTSEEFIAELKSFGIKFLVDVRSTPFSKWATHFNQGVIEQLLANNGIRYVYMGDTIGGRPYNEDCYNDEGYIDYKKMAGVQDFKNGLARLVTADTNGVLLAVMCSESDPSQCHRSKLIGRELYFEHGINMKHIIAPNKVKLETLIIEELTNNNWCSQGGLFGAFESPYFKSLKAYKNEALGEKGFEYD
jgi:uncharacterized protein (DUF488 family)